MCGLAREAERKFKDAVLAKAGAVPPQQQLVDLAGRVIGLKCGEPIPDNRLVAVPGAVRCQECQAE